MHEDYDQRTKESAKRFTDNITQMRKEYEIKFELLNNEAKEAAEAALKAKEIKLKKDMEEALFE